MYNSSVKERIMSASVSSNEDCDGQLQSPISTQFDDIDLRCASSSSSSDSDISDIYSDNSDSNSYSDNSDSDSENETECYYANNTDTISSELWRAFVRSTCVVTVLFTFMAL